MIARNAKLYPMNRSVTAAGSSVPICPWLDTVFCWQDWFVL